MLELLMTVVLAAGPLEAPGVGQLTDSLATHLAAHRSQTIGVPSFTRADGQPAELGAWVADEISQRLSRRFKVVERVKLKTLIEEDTLAQLKFTDGTGAVAKRSGVDLFVLGNVTRLKDGIDVNARVVRGADGRILFTASTLLPLGLAHADALPEQSAAPLTLSTLFLAERKVDGRYEDIQIRDGSTLRSGDGIKISFEVNRDAYVYAILVDSQGKASLVFPDERIRLKNTLPGGRTVEIPPGKQWFALDENTGTETLYVLASLDPLNDVDSLLQRLESLRDHQQIVAIEKQMRITRGFKKTLQTGRKEKVTLSSGEVVSRSRELLSGTGGVVRSVRFEHR